MKEIYQQTEEEVLREMNTSPNGITPEEAVKRQEKYGLNELTDENRKSNLILFLEQFKDFLVIILIIAAIVSGFLGDIESSLVILFVITMNAIIGTVQNIKAEQSLNGLKALSSPNAKVIRDGVTLVLPVNQVTVGDIVLLEAGDYVCADGRIIENASVKVNESALTGESLTVEKQTQAISKEAPIGDRLNMVFSGSYVTYGRCKFVVTSTGMNTEIGKIAVLLKNTKEKKTPLQVNLDNFGRKLSVIILIVCGILFITSMIRGEELVNAFMFAVALAVAAIPEALSSIVTIVLSFGTQKLAKEHAIIRKLQAVEGLGSVSVICSDKTGTLTQNKMTVKGLYFNNNVIKAEDMCKEDDIYKKLLRASVLCNDATNIDDTPIGDPTELALVYYSDLAGYPTMDMREAYPRLDEIPFDSDRKLMSTVHIIDNKRVMITKGATDVLIPRLKNSLTENGIIELKETDIQAVMEKNREFSETGLRVLCFAYKEIKEGEPLTLDSENDFTFMGLISMIDPPREESKEAVKKCIEAGIKPIMITGDHKITASAIAAEIGILKDSSEAVEGTVIDSMSDDELEKYVENISVYARVSPENKIRIVNAWQKKGNVVAMTGDGVNDAPALKQADVGVAMGITGSEVAKDAASMVLTDDNFATIVKAVDNGRNIYANIKKAIQFLLSGNTAGILAVLYASLLALPVPFAAVHLLFINLLTDSLPAIALGLEPHTKSVMKDKPRSINENILTKAFLTDILIEGFVIAVATMTGYYIGLNQLGEGGASTMAFATLCLSRLVHGFNCKSKKPVLFTKRFWNNKYLIGAFIIGFILLNGVLLLPVLQPVFSVTPIGKNLLFIVYGLAFSNLIVVQILKFIRRKLVLLKRNRTV